MKKSLLAMAALTAFAGVASAQSSVTLFGIVDLNARNLKTGANTIKSLSQDGIASSRLGFRGVEDLGGGMRAGFWLEGAIQPDVGTSAGQSWQRRSTLSLMGGFGEIRLGRDYVPSFWNQTVYDAFGTNGLADSRLTYSLLNSGAGGAGARANNSIGYFLPGNLGGFFGQVMVAAGENVIGNKYAGARFGYAAGPISVAVASGRWAKVNGMANTLSDTNIGGSYDAGFAKINAQFAKRKGTAVSAPVLFGAATPTAAQNTAYAQSGLTAGVAYDQKTMHLSTTVPMGAGNFKAAYTKNSGNVSDLDGTTVGLGYDYNLSKRTAVYGTVARTNWDGRTAASKNDRDQKGFEVGVRHIF